MSTQVCGSRGWRQSCAAQTAMPFSSWDRFAFQESGTAKVSPSFQTDVRPGALSCVLEGWSHPCSPEACMASPCTHLASLAMVLCIGAFWANKLYVSSNCPICASFLDYILSGLGPLCSNLGHPLASQNTRRSSRIKSPGLMIQIYDPLSPKGSVNMNPLGKFPKSSSSLWTLQVFQTLLRRQSGERRALESQDTGANLGL